MRLQRLFHRYLSTMGYAITYKEISNPSPTDAQDISPPVSRGESYDEDCYTVDKSDVSKLVDDTNKTVESCSCVQCSLFTSFKPSPPPFTNGINHSSDNHHTTEPIPPSSFYGSQMIMVLVQILCILVARKRKSDRKCSARFFCLAQHFR